MVVGRCSPSPDMCSQADVCITFSGGGGGLGSTPYQSPSPTELCSQMHASHLGVLVGESNLYPCPSKWCSQTNICVSNGDCGGLEIYSIPVTISFWIISTNRKIIFGAGDGWRIYTISICACWILVCRQIYASPLWVVIVWESTAYLSLSSSELCYQRNICISFGVGDGYAGLLLLIFLSCKLCSQIYVSSWCMHETVYVCMSLYVSIYECMYMTLYY